jgi:hypothetical protein
MRARSLFGHIAAVAAIVTGCVGSARSQAITNFDPPSVLVELLNNIKSVVESHRYGNPAEVYKTVSIGLGQCAMAYRSFSENQTTPKNTKGMAVSIMFSQAATALYPDDAQSANRALETPKDDSLQILSDKGLFFFLVNCDHSLKSGSAESAVGELLLANQKAR